MLCWCGVIGLLGVVRIVRNPKVLVAVNPVHAVEFQGSSRRWDLVLGEGSEHHRSKRRSTPPRHGPSWRGPIRRLDVLHRLRRSVVHRRQTALLIEKQHQGNPPFFSACAVWSGVPVVVLAYDRPR